MFNAPRLYGLPPSFHLPDHRLEYEQEEALQTFIDHELLCLSGDGLSGDGLTWNLQTGRGCDGAAIPAPPARTYRHAELWAYLPGVQRFLEREERRLDEVARGHVSAGGMAFVYDWVYQADTPDEVAPRDLRRVPVRLLGVRPDATRNTPSLQSTLPPGSDTCRLAEVRAGSRHAPIDLAPGSTSPFLITVGDLPLAGDRVLRGGTRLLLTGAGPDLGEICVTESRRGPKGAEPLALGGQQAAGITSLGRLTLGAGFADWQASLSDPGPDAAMCVRFMQGEDGVEIVPRGEVGRVEVAGRPADGAATLLIDEATVQIVVGEMRLDLVAALPATRDRAASSAVDERGRVVRTYHFGRDLSPVIGFGAYAGGIEGAGEDAALWGQARARWRDSCKAADDRADQGVQLTLRGDLQRIVASELATVTAACRAGLAPCGGGESDSEWWREQVTASAVLMEASTGDLLAVANDPAFEPNDDQTIADLLAEIRGGQAEGLSRGLVNRAFLRNRHAGSTYKLATSYAMAREGLLDRSSGRSGGAACRRFAIYQAQETESGAWGLSPTDSPLSLGVSSACKTKQPVDLGDPATGFPRAFRWSHNPYFVLAPLALIDGSGVRYGQTIRKASDRWKEENPIGRRTGLWAGSGFIGGTLAPDFELETALADPETNPFLAVMVALGHRYLYPQAEPRRVIWHTQNVDGVGATRYPTTGPSRWLPGLKVAHGFRYPSFRGPESYSMDGRARRLLSLDIHVGDHTEPRPTLIQTERLREYWKLSYGFGGVEASALSLAVLATPAARDDAEVIAPNLVASPTIVPDEGPRVLSEGLLGDAAKSPARRDVLRSAMYEVLRSGTASGIFNGSPVRNRVGGKTGTFAIDVVHPALEGDTREERVRLERTLRRLMAVGCGVRGLEMTAEDWGRVDAEITRVSGRRKGVDEPLVRAGLSAAAAEVLEPGWGASADVCVTYNYQPGRLGLSRTLPGEGSLDGGIWLDALMAYFPPQATDTSKMEGSSFIGVTPDGLADGPGGEKLGQGWVLAVIMDGHSTGAKWASRAILERLRQHLLAAALPQQDEDEEDGG